MKMNKCPYSITMRLSTFFSKTYSAKPDSKMYIRNEGNLFCDDIEIGEVKVEGDAIILIPLRFVKQEVIMPKHFSCK